MWSTECRCRWRSWGCAGISMSQARQWAASIFLKKCSWPIPVDNTPVLWDLGRHLSDASLSLTPPQGSHFLPVALRIQLGQNLRHRSPALQQVCGDRTHGLHNWELIFNFAHPSVLSLQTEEEKHQCLNSTPIISSL